MIKRKNEMTNIDTQETDNTVQLVWYKKGRDISNQIFLIDLSFAIRDQLYCDRFKDVI